MISLNKEILFGTMGYAMGSYFLSNKIALLIYKLTLKIQSRKDREKDIETLLHAYFEIQEKMQQIEKQITHYPQDNEAIRFISDYIKKMQNEQEQIGGKEMSKLLYNISKRLDSLENELNRHKELLRQHGIETREIFNEKIHTQHTNEDSKP